MEQEKRPGDEGIILRGVGGLYTVWRLIDRQEHVLRARGIFRREKRAPMVGDHVLCTPGEGEQHGWIEDILPRRNACLRPPVANVDQLLLVIAPSPQPDWLLIDKLLVWARRAGIAPMLAVNKADVDSALAAQVAVQYAGTDIPVYPVSAKTGVGITALKAALTDKVTCLAGQSAVGKSSLLNALFGLRLATGGLSRKVERGKHTTRHAELMRCENALVVDTPGFSLLELWEKLPPEELCSYYPEYGALAGQCRFQPCQHDREPDCAVQEAVGQGALSLARWQRYRALLDEVRIQWRGRYD